MSWCLRQRARADTQPKVKLPVQTPVRSPPGAAIERFVSSLATSTNSLCRQNEHGPFISTASPETSNPLPLVVLATLIIASTWSLVPVDRHPAQSRVDVVSIDRLARYGLSIIDLAENLVRLIQIPSYHHHLGFIELDNHLAFLPDLFLLRRARAKQDRDDYQQFPKIQNHRPARLIPDDYS